MQDESYLRDAHIVQEYQEIDRVERHRQSLLTKELERLTRERDALAKAIGDAGVKAGIISDRVALTGPQLISLCDDLAERIEDKKS